MPEPDNTNAQPAGSNMRSAIIIGLGGTGLEVMTMVRRMIVERFGGLDRLPIISFLHIDTATEEPALTPTSVLGQDLSLSERERITLRMPVVTDGGASYLGNHPMIREWFPTSLKIENDFTLGAGAVRAYGRIAFAENAQQIERALHECAKRVNDDDQRRFVAGQWGAVDDGIDVYVVCSLLGGTGSGTFLDAAYLARHVLKQFHSNTQVLGFLIIGGGSSVESVNLANCYGALKELVHYSTEAQKSKKSGASAFSAQYPRITQRIESGAVTPFSFCYLASNFNEQQAQFSRESLFELVAQNIFLEFTPGVAAAKRAIRSNIAAHNFSDLDGRLGQAQSFLSFGISTIEFPALRVEDCLAYRLAGEAMAYFSFSNAPADGSLTGQVKQDLQDWGLDPERLLKALITDDAGRTLLQQAAGLKNQKQTELQKYIPREQRDQLLVYLRNYLDLARGDVNVTLDPAMRGAHIKQIELKARNLLDAAISQLRRRVAEKISSPYGGVRNTLTYLQSLESNLKTFEKNYRTAEDLQQRRGPAAAERETKAFARVGREKREANDGEMRTLVNDTFAAALEFSEATILDYANRQARLLLTGDDDEQERGDCLLKEIKRLASQIEEFTSRLARFSVEFAGRRERDQSGREMWNGGRHGDLRANLTAGAYNSDVLVDPGEIDSLYQACIPHPVEKYLWLKDEVQRRLGEDDAPLSIFQCVIEQPEQTRNISVEASRNLFQQVREISIAKKLSALPQAEVERRIQEAARRSHVLLRFDSDSLFAADNRTGGQMTGHNPGYHSFAMLATCHPQHDAEVNLDPAPGQQPSKLALAFRSQTTGIKHEKALPDRYRLVFVREKGVFPLYSVEEVKALRNAYLNEMRQHNAKPRETDRRVDFPDIFPLSQTEIGMPGRVERALTLGRAFKLVRHDRDVRTEEPAIIYAYRDEHHRLNEIILGRDLKDAAQAIVERQIKKEVYHERGGEETSLEHLENLLDAEGRRPARLSEKEAAWAQLQEYLRETELDLDDGERDPQYQREAGIIDDFRNQYGWRSPQSGTDFSPFQYLKPVPPAPVLSTRLIGPTQLMGNAAPTQILSEDEASFRKRVAIKLRRNGAGSLPIEEITRLMQEGIEDYHLSPGAARQIIDEAQSENTAAAAPDARSAEKYRELCREILESGASFDDERATLEDKRRRLDLTPAQAQTIEEQVRREQSHAYLKGVK